MLVRHLEVVGDALDPFLVEPAVWQLEFSRSINERSSGLAARIPELSNPERRKWSLREVGMTLTLPLHLTSRATVSDDYLIWSARVLLQVDAATTTRDDDLDYTVFAQGADRSAGRARPALLLPAAAELRSALSVLDADKRRRTGHTQSRRRRQRRKRDAARPRSRA